MSRNTFRATTILDTLRSGPATAYTLASILDAPEASVRRTIQGLRDMGHDISDARDEGGLYRLTVTA